MDPKSLLVIAAIAFLAFQETSAHNCYNCWWFGSTPPPNYISSPACRNDPESLTATPAPSGHLCIKLTTQNVTMFRHDNSIFYQGALTWRSSMAVSELGGGSHSECDHRIPNSVVELLEKQGNYRNAHWYNSRFCQCGDEDSGCNSASGTAISILFIFTVAGLAGLFNIL